ncbi:MAG TPA: hypothetical protein VHY10_20095, partial [Xanthobacteraceae bacterium]|nr:hypothetical protein [Xanthobacteraceae bacterium]
MSPIFSGDVDVAPADEDISALHSSLSSSLGASAAEAWNEGPTSQLLRIGEMSAAKGMVPDFGGPVSPELAKQFSDQPDVSREAALGQVKAAGLDKQVSVPDSPHVKQGAIDLMIQHAREENQRAATIADGPRGYMAGALDMGTGFLVGAADPLNVAASMIPVVGEARYAKLLSGAGSSIMARAAVRLGTGLAGGAAFGAGFLPLQWAAETSDGRDFTLTQALRSVLSSAGQFGFLHVGGGLMSDLWRSIGPSRARRPLYPFAPGEPFERSAQPAAAEPGLERGAGELGAAEPAAAASAAPGATPAEAIAAAPAEAAGRARAEASPEVSKGTAPRTAKAGAANLDQVLDNARVATRFANVRIDSDHDVPFGAGADAEDPNVVHVDKHVPHQDTINGVEYDPRVPVALHEIAEHDGMEHDGLSYQVAHRMRGEVAEKAWVDQHLGPGAWPIYTRRWDGWLSHIEPEKVEDVPQTLYDKPYPFKQREQIERLQRHEAAAAGERKQIAKEVSTGVYRAGRPKEEANTGGALFAARYATRASRFGYRAGSALDLFRSEHLGIHRGAENFIHSGRAFDQGRATPPDLFAEREAEGQQNLPGTERIGQGELAQRRADQPLRPSKEQKPMDIGLFGDAAAQKTLFQEEAVPSWYYSAVGRAVEGTKLEKASPAQWLATIKNTPGVKGEELEWLGLDDWLKQHKGQVTKAELADYVRANQIELREVEKGGAGIGEDAVERMALEQPDDFTKRLTDAGISLTTALSYRRSVQLGNEAAIREVAAMLGEANPAATKFGQYTLPGGENYRELLLTLPEKPGVRGPKGWGDTGGGTADTANFLSGHWDEPNVLAHVRFDDRMVAGKRDLHLAEIQSDWHQKGRKHGYDVEKPFNRYQLLDGEGASHGVYDTPEAAEAARQRLHGETYPGARTPNDTTAWRVDPVEVRSGVGVPDAPFKTTWPELALKRMIRYAAENGYDRLSWDTGETNAERYDLSKHISRLYFKENADRTFFLRGEDLSGRTFPIRERVSADKLPDHVGKDVTDRILGKLENAPDHDGEGSLEGVDLKVGGEGMRGFYDKMLPAAAAKLTKKFGARVETTKLPQPRVQKGLMTQAEWDAARELPSTRTVPIHSLAITPQLREAATSQGFPLFQGGEAGPRGRITLRPNRAIIDLFKSGDTSTFLHEAGHLWLEELVRDAAHDEAPQQMRDDLGTVLKWLGVDKPEDIGTAQHEQWARGFEQYLMEGRAPSKRLAGVFEKFREWLSAIYRSVAGLREPITDDVRGVMDRMLASDPEIAKMQGAMRRLPDPAKEDILRGTIGSMADGKASPAADMIKAGAEQNAAVARAAASIPGVGPEQSADVPQTEADRVEAFQAIAGRPAPHEEEAAIAAFTAAEKLPEPPSIDAEPPKTANLAANLAEARRAAAEGRAVDLKVNTAAPRGPRARPEATWSLMEFLASRGGIDPNERNIADVRTLLGRSNKFIPGFGHLIRKGGLALDRAREAAVEAQYLRDNGQTGASAGLASTTTRDLLDALDDEARGRRRYREGVAPRETERDPAAIARDAEEAAELNNALDAGLREFGIDPTALAPDLRSRTLEIMTREGEADPVLAWERAVGERDIDEAEAGQYERSAHAIPGWDEPDDAGAAPGEGGGAEGAVGRPGPGDGAAARAPGLGAGEAGGQGGEGLPQRALSPIAKAAVEADRRSAANFEIEAADLPEAERARIDEAIAAVDREAAITDHVIELAAGELGAGADAQTAIARTVGAVADAPRATIEQEVKALDGAIKSFEQDGIAKGEAAQRAADARLDKNAERRAIARRAEREHSVAIMREVRRLKELDAQKVPVRDALESITAGVNTPFLRARASIEATWHTLHNKYVGDGGVDGALRREGLAKLAFSQVIDPVIEREAYELDRGDKGNPGVTKNKQALRIAQILHAADKQAMDDHNLSGGWLRSLAGHTARQQWNPDAIRMAALGGNQRGVFAHFRASRQPQDELHYLKYTKGGSEQDRVAFVSDFMANLDLKRTFGRMPAQAIRDELYQLWVPLKNGDHFDYTAPTDDPIYPNVAGKAAAHRALFFKSPAAARAMRQKYGLYQSFVESKFRGYETLARQTALIGRLGPKPEEAMEEIRNRALELTKAGPQRQAVEKFVQGRGGEFDGSMLEKQLAFLTGKANRPLYSLGARVLAGWMVWERMSMLGRVLLTHIEGLPTKSSELRYWGASAGARYGGFFADMRRAAPESDRGKLMQLIWSAHDADNAYRASRYDSADTAPGILSRLSDIYFRLTGITHVLPNQRQGAQHVMARELALERGKSFDQVDPRITRILSLYGIGDKEWQLLHGTDWTRGRTPDGAGPGGSSESAYLTPDDALKLPDASVKAYLEGKHPLERPADATLAVTPEQIARARNDLATAIATMYDDRGAYAMFQGASVRTKARLYGNSQPGTLGGAAIRLMWQFKQWPVEMIYRTWGREIYGGQQGMGRVASIVELAVAATVMGTLGEMVRDAIKGEDPIPNFAAHPVRYLLRGMMRSGVGSIAGDYLLGEFDRHFRTVLESVAGPTFGQIDDLADLYYGGGAQERHPWHERGADLMQLLKTNGGPVVNFWATSWAFQYLLLYRLQEWMHPGYVERYQR